MDVIGFLCVSLCSSTVHLHDSLGSRLGCTCSEDGFSSQNGDRIWEYTTEEQRSVVRFFFTKGLGANDTHKETFPVYGVKCLSLKTVQKWFDKFSQGRSKVADDAQPGRHVVTATEATVQLVEELIRADRRITIDSVATALGCSHGLAHSIMPDHLKFRKVCARWVSRELKGREEMNRMGLSLQRLLRYADGEDMFNRMVTGDESWVRQWNGNIPVHLQRNRWKLRVRHQPRMLCFLCFGILGEYC
jgi:hypothetical protein